MKLVKSLTYCLVFFFLLGMLPNHGQALSLNTEETEDLCPYPDHQVDVTVYPDGDGYNLTFDETTFIKGYCITFVLINADNDTTRTTGDDDLYFDHFFEMEDVYKQFPTNESEDATINVEMPDKDTKVDAWLGGMKDDTKVELIVGDGEESDDGFLPGFGIPLALFTLIAVSTSVIVRRKKE
ncbi:MAG: hypothetical protein ACXAD7_15195 [Candidatus Kariarchaeaceae archaeon]